MRRVLIIDDSKLIRTELQAALDPYGFEIDHAENGGIALQKLTIAQWDLVFLDIQLPIMDGPTLLRLARARGLTSPVVLVTSVSAAPVVSNALRLGATHYILKPFTAEQIRGVAARMLRLDPKQLEAPPPQILLQHTDPNLPTELAAQLPAHVLLDTSHSIGQSLDLIEEGSYNLVLIESDELGDEVSAVAELFRRSLPAAGIFAVSSHGAGATAWTPDGGLDGILPRPLGESLVHGFLYPNFVRTQVFVEGINLRTAGFHGEERYLEAYFTSLERTVIARATEAGMVDACIDLTYVPALPERVATLIGRLTSALRANGAAPSFKLGDAVRGALTGRGDLSTVPLF